MRLRPWRSVECAVFHFWVYVCRRNMLKVKNVKRTLICKHHPIHWLPLCGEPGFDPSSSRALAGLSECQVCPTMVGEFLPLPQCKRGWEGFCWNLFWWDPLRTHVFDCVCGAWIGMNDMCGFGTMQPCIVRILDCFGLCLFGLVWNWVQKMKKITAEAICYTVMCGDVFGCKFPMYGSHGLLHTQTYHIQTAIKPFLLFDTHLLWLKYLNQASASDFPFNCHRL